MVPIPNYLEKLDGNVMILGLKDMLKESHLKTGLNYRQAGELLNLSESFYRYHLQNKPHAKIEFLKRFSEKIDSNIFNKIYAKDVLEFTAKKKKVILPKEISPDLAYFFGYLQGDGCLTSSKKEVCFDDEYIEQINKINELSQKLFGVSGHIREKRSPIAIKGSLNLEIKSVVLNSFFNRVLGINRGIKKNMKIPKLIKENKALLRVYIAGLYDADGTLPKEPEQAVQLFIDITMKDREFIKEIKEALLNFGIETHKIYERIAKSPNSDFISKTHEIRIRRKAMLLKFLQEISFYHPNKAIRVRKMMDLLDR